MESAGCLDEKGLALHVCGAIARGRAIHSATETCRENSLRQHGTVMYPRDPSTARKLSIFVLTFSTRCAQDDRSKLYRQAAANVLQGR
jgi:hypothetical protein